MNIAIRVLLAADQSACLILTGQNDFTISAWAYLRHVEKNKPFCMNAINKMFFWQKEHCKGAFYWEMREAQKLYNKYKHLL